MQLNSKSLESRMQENDLEGLIARFVTAIEIAEATAQTLQTVTAPLTRVSARIEALDPPLAQHQAQIEKLAHHLPALTAELTSAAAHLRSSLRPDP
jgi:ABC-type transporter Mla subunit MlaD